MDNLKLEKILTLTTIMTLMSGVKIGGSNEEINIGGVDNPIVRNPMTKEPYIPGSSFKGSLRSLLEIVKGVSEENNGICTCGKCPVCKLFGMHPKSGNANKLYREPSRLIVRDAELTEKSRIILRNFNPSMVEIKKENTINRITAVANPRTIERIPAGVEFKIEMQLRIFKDDNENNFKSFIENALKLLTYNYIGSSGSRGYGKVKFSAVEWDDESLNIIEELNKINEQYAKEGE
jgi:CRISPR-associated protein Csm3